MTPHLIGENFLPESVMERRRKVRNKLQEFRQPIQSKRESLIPGPNVIGEVESSVKSLRDKLVSRESVLNRVKSMRSQSDSGGSSSGSSGSSNGSTGSSNTNSTPAT